MQIAHMISQLFENVTKIIKEVEITLKEIHSKLFNKFKTLNIEKYIDTANKGYQIRFS